ncbi:MAG: hypothetical protein AAF202_02815, partial [Pseudomonadota bacterium]
MKSVFASSLVVIAIVMCSVSVAEGGKVQELKPSEESGLAAAYKREYAFLLAQKKILEDQKRALESENEERVVSAQGKLAELRAQYVALAKSNEKLAAQLETVQLRSENQGQIFSQLEGMLEQAEATVQIEKSEAPASLGDQLATVFSKAKSKLENLSRVSEAKGSFFLASGEKVEGDITRIGGIASFGKANGFTGALMPAGDGLMRARPELTLESISIGSLAGQSSIDVFIFEDTSKEYKEASAPTVVETIESGGSIAWIIVFMGLLSLFVVGVRALRLKGLGGVKLEQIEEIENSLQKGDLATAKGLAGDLSGSVGKLVRTGVTSFDRTPALLPPICLQSTGVIIPLSPP